MRPLTVKEVAAINQARHLAGQPQSLRAGERHRHQGWLFRYMLNGRAHGMGLGSLELVTLAEARDKALLCRKLLLDGIDPLEERRTKRTHALLTAAGRVTFRDCAERYIEAHALGWRNGKHRQQWRNTLKTYAYPVIGDLPVAEIDTTLVLRIIEPLWTTKTETASRLRGRIESILDWATARNYRTGENPARWRGHLDKLLPKRSKVAPVNHHDALPYAELPAFMQKLRHQAGIARAVSGVHDPDGGAHRRGDRAQWSEIDLDARTWKVPAERMKAGKEHIVPLSNRAIEILAALPRSVATSYSRPAAPAIRSATWR